MNKSNIFWFNFYFLGLNLGIVFGSTGSFLFLIRARFGSLNCFFISGWSSWYLLPVDEHPPIWERATSVLREKNFIYLINELEKWLTLQNFYSPLYFSSELCKICSVFYQSYDLQFFRFPRTAMNRNNTGHYNEDNK